jgi:hypothetical protein
MRSRWPVGQGQLYGWTWQIAWLLRVTKRECTSGLRREHVAHKPATQPRCLVRTGMGTSGSAMHPMNSGVSGEKHGSDGCLQMDSGRFTGNPRHSTGRSCVNAADGESRKIATSGGLASLGTRVYLGNQESLHLKTHGTTSQYDMDQNHSGCRS